MYNFKLSHFITVRLFAISNLINHVPNRNMWSVFYCGLSRPRVSCLCVCFKKHNTFSSSERSRDFTVIFSLESIFTFTGVFMHTFSSKIHNSCRPIAARAPRINRRSLSIIFRMKNNPIPFHNRILRSAANRLAERRYYWAALTL